MAYDRRLCPALIFDCDGTLADTMPTHYRCWLECAASLWNSFSEERFYALAHPAWRCREAVDQRGGRRGRSRATLARAKEDAFLVRSPRYPDREGAVRVARAGRGVVPMAVASAIAGSWKNAVTQILPRMVWRAGCR